MGHNSIGSSRRSACSWSAALALLGLVVMFGSLLLVRHEQQYVRLAESFLSGKLHLLVELPEHLHDTALYGGRYYWPLGPFPAVLLMPFVRSAAGSASNFTRPMRRCRYRFGLAG